MCPITHDLGYLSPNSFEQSFICSPYRILIKLSSFEFTLTSG